MSENTPIEEKSFKETQQELIMSDDFEKALVSGAEIQNNEISLCKSRSKSNYNLFYDIMIASNREIQSILDMKKNQRSDEDNEKVKEFKKTTSRSYKQISKLLAELHPSVTDVDDTEDVDEENSIEKMVHKITDIVKLFNYIGETSLEDEFKKNGIELTFTKMDDDEFFAQEHIKEQITSLFQTGKDIANDMEFTKNRIKKEIFHETVPLDLQYDKNNNPSGIKDSDFCKLVSLKAKLMSTEENDDAQEKTKEKAEKMASEYVFQNQRNEILNRKVTEFAS